MGKDDKAIYKEGDFVLSLSEGIVPAAIISRKAVQAYRTYTWNQQEINDILALEKGADKILKNANLIKALLFGFEAATQVPVARLYIKSENLKNAFDSDFEMWQRILFFLGYSTWNLGLNIEDGNGKRGRTGPLDFGPNLDFKGLEFKPKLNF